MAKPKKYRKKPVVIEAIHHDGTAWAAVCIGRWTGLNINLDGSYSIPTLEGSMRADVGDYIIKGVAGEFYPCKPDIFEATYEAVEPAADLPPAVSKTGAV